MVVFIGDLHIGISSDSIDIDGTPSKTVEVLKVLDHVIKFCIENRADLVMCGDIFHMYNPKPNIEAQFFQRLAVLENAKINTHIIPGNHDVKRSGACSLLPCQEAGYKNIHIYTNIKCVEFEQCFIIFVPYLPVKQFPDVGRYIEMIVGEEVDYLLDKGKKIVVCCHHLFQGGVLSGEKFFISNSEQSFEVPDGVDWVISGHIHKSQRIVLPSDIEVFYTGSLVQTNVLEAGENKNMIVMEGKEVVGLDFVAFENLSREYSVFEAPIDSKLEYKVIRNAFLEELYQLKRCIVHVNVTCAASVYDPVEIEDLKNLLLDSCYLLAKFNVDVVSDVSSEPSYSVGEDTLDLVLLRKIETLAADERRDVVIAEHESIYAKALEQFASESQQ